MDKYDEHIERLVERPHETEMTWFNPPEPLFQYCHPNGTKGTTGVGCLTVIRGWDDYTASDATLTEAIREDGRIDRSPYALERRLGQTSDLDERRRILSVYADYQRDMDDTIRQGKPWVANRSRLPEHV